VKYFKELNIKDYLWLFIILLLSIGSFTSVGVLLYHLIFNLSDAIIGIFFVSVGFVGALIAVVCNLPYDTNF
jgi:hypothetical protein